MIIVLCFVLAIFICLAVFFYAKTLQIQSENNEIRSMNTIMDLEIEEKDVEIQDLRDKLDSFGDLVLALDEIEER